MDDNNAVEETMRTPQQYVLISASESDTPVIVCRLIDQNGLHVVELEVRNERYQWLADDLTENGVFYNDVIHPEESRQVTPFSGVTFLAALAYAVKSNGIYASEIHHGQIPRKKAA